MFWPKFVISLVAISVLGACSVKTKPSNKKPACPTATDQSLDPQRTLTRRTVELSGTRQRVIRINCAGKVRSNKIETTEGSLVNGVKVHPTRQFTDADSSGYNRTTCNSIREDAFHNLFSRGTKKDPVFRFSPHTSPTFFGTGRVKKNADNYIDYEFTKCVERSADGQTCLRTDSLEKGTLILTVVYSETQIDETLEVKDACEQKPQ